jgi:hypothetical protein
MNCSIGGYAFFHTGLYGSLTAAMPPFAQPSMAFDFSQFFGGDSKRPIEFIGLTSEQTAALLANQYGISQVLMENYPDVTKRGDGPNAVMKCLIVFEHEGRDTTYEQIGQACGISVDTAYQQMSKARNWVRDGLKLKIEHSGDRVFLITTEAISIKCERIDSHIQKIEKVMKDLNEDVLSVKQAGQVPVLPFQAAAYLGAHEQVQLHAAGN